MNKLENALCALGLNMDFFDELKSEVKTEKLVAENGLLATTQEDVEDEFEHLEGEEITDSIDEDDENQVDMKTLSPLMRKLYE
jgi:uncharacterized membrane protein